MAAFEENNREFTASFSRGQTITAISVEKVEQTKEATESEGVNELTITLTDGSTFKFLVRNGEKGDTPIEEIEKVENQIIDKLCPSFTESGAMVTCEPIEGYPLTVTAEEGATTITRCGKNLLSEDWKVFGNYTDKYFYLDLKPGKYVIAAERNAPTDFYLRKLMDGATADTKYLLMSTNDTEFHNIAFEVTATAGEQWVIRCGSQVNINNVKWVQIEVGSKFTSYEEYRGEAFAVGETIPALQGVNHIFADVGEVTVTGKADPVAIIEKLNNAILATGGNV